MHCFGLIRLCSCREADEFKKLMSSLADFTPKEWECEAGGAGDRAFFLVAGTRLSDGNLITRPTMRGR